MKHALISVHNKTGITEFAKELETLGIQIIVTSGTHRTLTQAGIRSVKHVSEITGYPEILDGRVKTLHPKLLAGILAQKQNKIHRKQLEAHGITPIDLVVCNLYPFEKITRQEADLETALENIDVGGPTMIRAAAKNFENVTVIVKPSRYKQVLSELKQHGSVSLDTRRALAAEAFRETPLYDKAIYRFLKDLTYT